MSKKTLDEEWQKWLNDLGNRLMKAVKLIDETEEPEKLNPKAQKAYALAETCTRRHQTTWSPEARQRIAERRKRFRER